MGAMGGSMPATDESTGAGSSETLIDRFGAAWAAHDLDAALRCVSEDCVFDATGPAPDGIRHHGRTALRSAWQPIFDAPDTMFEVEETVAAGDRVVQRWTYRFDGGHVRGIDLYRIRDGLIAEKFSYVKG